MSIFSKVIHVGEESVAVTGDGKNLSIAISRQSVRLTHEEADELVEALRHGRTLPDGFTAAEVMDARAEGFRDGRKAPLRSVTDEDVDQAKAAFLARWKRAKYSDDIDVLIAVRVALENFHQRLTGEGI